MKTCNECPFNKSLNLTKDDLGGSSPEIYLGQLNAPFILACHLNKNYRGKETDFNIVSMCKGAAMLRNKIEIRDKFNSKFTPIMEDVNNEGFNSNADFLAHYKNISLKEATKLTDENHIQEYLINEYEKLKYEGKIYKS